MENFAEYGRALASVALFALIALALNPWVGVVRGNAGLAPGEMPRADYSDRTYRIARAYQNTVEMVGVFGAVVAAAALAGAPPFWVNLFASIALLARIAMIYVHIQGIGMPERGPRTMLFVLGWLMMVLIALMALVAAF